MRVPHLFLLILPLLTMMDCDKKVNILDEDIEKEIIKSMYIMLSGGKVLRNLIKEKIMKKEKVLGTFFQLGGSTSVECLGIAGLDFLVIDTEHGPLDVEQSIEYIRTAELRNITPFVRIKDISRPSVLKMLDIGAKGLIVPCVETVNQIKDLVKWAKYYPTGQRGFFTARPAGYGFKDFAKDIDNYFKICNEETLLIPQCETMGCLENIEEITNIEGVDGIFIGPYDLSIAMRKPGQFNDSEFLQGVTRILKACKAAKKLSFIYTGDNKMAKRYFTDGFDGVAVNFDAAVLINAYKKLIGEIKG
ncbi:MAG: aldolase/citrate lyase family protein [Firmicutes bacterium]|nr:aldolase/citrate lyase family protein [Bacillota bacterium]